MTQVVTPPAPSQTTASEFLAQMETFAGIEGTQGFAMHRETFQRLVRETGNEWHKAGGLRHVYTVGPKDTPLLGGKWIVIRFDIPIGKVARIAERPAPVPAPAPLDDVVVTEPPAFNDGPPLVIRTPAQIIIEKVQAGEHRLRDKAGKGRRNRYA